MNATAGIYRNTSVESGKSKGFIRIDLTSKSKNTYALGTKLKVFTPAGTFSYENNPVHGFQSSMSGPIHIGIAIPVIDSIIIIWPSGTTDCLKDKLEINKTYFLRWNH